MAKRISETKKEKEFRDMNHNFIDTDMVMSRILQRPKENSSDATESVREQHKEESPPSKCSLVINKDLGVTQKRSNDDLLSLVTSTSECCKEEMEERFEQNCQLFDVSSEDFA